MADQKEIEQAVSQLNGMINGTLSDAFNFFSDGKKNYKAIWDQIRETGKLFKGSHFESKEKRQEVWNEFQSLVKQMKERREEHQRNLDRKSENSERHYNAIVNMLPMSREGEGFVDTVIAIGTGGLSVGAKLAADAIFGEEDEERARLLRAGEAIKDAGQYLSSNKTEMTFEDKNRSFEKTKWARERLDKEWEDYNGRKRAVKAQKQSEWEKKRLAHEERQAEWRAKTGGFVEKQREWVSKMERAISSKETNISKLQSQIYESSNSNWISRAEG